MWMIGALITRRTITGPITPCYAECELGVEQNEYVTALAVMRVVGTTARAILNS